MQVVDGTHDLSFAIGKMQVNATFVRLGRWEMPDRFVGRWIKKNNNGLLRAFLRGMAELFYAV
jgi:hypothetical protein